MDPADYVGGNFLFPIFLFFFFLPARARLAHEKRGAAPAGPSEKMVRVRCKQERPGLGQTSGSPMMRVNEESAPVKQQRLCASRRVLTRGQKIGGPHAAVIPSIFDGRPRGLHL